jgi:lysophospholipase L1-like esterase
MRLCDWFRVTGAGLLALGVAAAARAEDFAIRDGDTVVFLGDSITAARVYGKLVENYTLLRYPQRKVRFLNAGIGGDTAAGGLKRLERDVFANGATLLTVAYGINDIGWGVHADEAHKRTYLEAVRGIVEACRKRGVRVFVCSAAVTAQDPNQSEDGFLQRMCDEGMALSRSLGGQAIDVQRTMRAIQKKIWAANETTADKTKHTTLHAADGVHLNELGQLAMAFALLKGLGAPADVSAVRIDAGGPKLLEARGCAVTDLARKDGVLEFTRLDEGLPLNNGLFFGLNFRFIPIPDDLNRYLLAVTNLPEDRYEVVADGRGVGTFTARQLATGVNIASSTPDAWQPGGPWNAQANILQALTDARHNLATARGLASFYLQGSPTPQLLGPQADRTNEQIESMQRTVAAPRPYRFRIQRFVPPPKEGKKPEK